jgi:S-disulfanyl-L-cysteine oxidoreductase SoxD
VRNSNVGRVLVFRLRSRGLLASFGQARRSAFGAKAAGPAECRVVAIAIACVAFAVVVFAQSVGASVWDGVFTEEQVKRGAAAYQRECSNCHGPALEGGDMTPPLVGGAFTSNWNGLTLGDLFERIRLTMPLDNPGRLSRQQNVDVIAFILQANTWPSGAAELAPDVGALKQIRIEANRR